MYTFIQYYIFTYTHTYIYTYLHICICAYIHICMCIYIYILTYMHMICTCKHIYTHIYIYMLCEYPCLNSSIPVCRLDSTGALRCLRPASMWERFRCRWSLELMSPDGLGNTISSLHFLNFRLASLRLTTTVFFAMA